MRSYPLIDYIEACQARDAGMALVVENEQAEWRELYHALADRWLDARRPDDLFTFEDVRLAMIRDHAIPPPHHPNVWGGMANGRMKAWIAAGRIKPHGQQRQREVRHGRFYPLYEVLAVSHD